MFQPTIGLGAGAHSYFMGHRYSNSKDLDNYLNNSEKLPKDYNEMIYGMNLLLYV